MTLPNNASLQDVINNLNSTQGINAKAELASVIGLPAIASEEVVAQTIKLQNAKNTFASKIGVDNTIPIQEMADLLTITGKVAVLNATRTSANNISVSGLDFTPRVVFGVISTVSPNAYFALSTDSTFPVNKISFNSSLDRDNNATITVSDGGAVITSTNGYIQAGNYVVIVME